MCAFGCVCIRICEYVLSSVFAGVYRCLFLVCVDVYMRLCLYLYSCVCVNVYLSVFVNVYMCGVVCVDRCLFLYFCI